MLKIKLLQHDSLSWYKIKVNGKQIDSGVLEDKEEVIGLNEIDFLDDGRAFISISSSVEKPLYVKEICYSKQTTESKITAGENFNSDSVASGLIENINELLEDNFSNATMSGAVGGGLEWFFLLEENGNVSLWSESGWATFEQKIPVLNGYCEITLPDGSLYKGNVENDFLSGYGKKTYVDGTIYEGEFSYDLRHGVGKVFYTNGAVFEGNFKQERFDGPGKIAFPNGAILESDFIENDVVIIGKLEHNDYILEGKFKNYDQTTDSNVVPLSKILTLEGQVTYPGKEILKGHLIYNTITGELLPNSAHRRGVIKLHLTDCVISGIIEQNKFIYEVKEYSNGIKEHLHDFNGELLEPKIFNGIVYSATPDQPCLRVVEGELLLEESLMETIEYLTNKDDPRIDPKYDHFTQHLIDFYPQDLQQYYYNYYKENNQ